MSPVDLGNVCWESTFVSEPKSSPLGRPSSSKPSIPRAVQFPIHLSSRPPLHRWLAHFRFAARASEFVAVAYLKLLISFSNQGSESFSSDTLPVEHEHETKSALNGRPLQRKSSIVKANPLTYHILESIRDTVYKARRATAWNEQRSGLPNALVCTAQRQPCQHLACRSSSGSRPHFPIYKRAICLCRWGINCQQALRMSCCWVSSSLPANQC